MTHPAASLGSAARSTDNVNVNPGLGGIVYPLSLFLEFEKVVDGADSSSGSWVHIQAGNNDKAAFRDAMEGGNLTGFIQKSGSNTMNRSVGPAAVGTHKVAMRCQENASNAAMDGTAATEDTSVVMPDDPTRINFGSEHDPSVNKTNGYLRKLALFSGAKADAALEAMTT